MKKWVMLLAAVLLTACGGGNTSQEGGSGVAALPAGDAARGAELFAQQIDGAPACTTCHTLTDQALNGPGMAGYSTRAATRVEGQSAQEYTYTSITQPAAYIVPGFGNIMYPLYRQRLTSQQLSDLIAYLLTL
jgi:mono/diheme cytochrome c family protein